MTPKEKVAKAPAGLRAKAKASAKGQGISQRGTNKDKALKKTKKVST